MRTTKFRGQRIDNKEWVYGDLITNDGLPFIVNRVIDSNEEWITLEEWSPVIPETVGQFFGLTDKDGEEIYEGDTVKIFYNQNSENYAGNNFNYTEHICIVEFSTYSSSFVLRNMTEKYKGRHNFTTIKFDHRRLQKDRIQKIGTIHTNPELLNN